MTEAESKKHAKELQEVVDKTNQMPDRFPEEFKNDDTIFHYTKMNTAIKLILHEEQLKLSPRLNHSSDPFERFEKRVATVEFGNVSDNDFDQKAQKLKEKMNDRFSNVKQLCFSRNNFIEIDGIKMITYDHCGFMKTRMWDQYGDQYKGVCLAFSVQKILDKNCHFKKKKISYESFQELRSMVKKLNIDPSSFKTQSEEVITEEKLGLAEQIIFSKDKGYVNEDEIRLCNNEGETNDLIEIQGCLVGIIVSNQGLEDFDLKALSEYSRRFNVPFRKIDWKHYELEFPNPESV